MLFTPEQIAAWVAHLPALAPGADAGTALAWLREHLPAAEEAVAEQPGHDQVRAGLIRALPGLGDAVEPTTWVSSARAALDAYDPEHQDGADHLRRTPAWVGLAALEVGLAEGRDAAQAQHGAKELAARGFRALQSEAQAGDGEVWWALAEAAADVGWTDHAEPLLRRAAEAPFADPHNRARVWLLRILERLEAGDEDVDEALDALLALESVDGRTRVHGLWVGALRDRVAGRLARALTRLTEARDLLQADPGADPAVLGRIERTIAALQGGGGAAEA